jgi:FG-GAP-like repeat
VCGRSTGGIVCALSTINLTFGAATTWTTTFGDNGGWNVAKSYWGTVRFPDVNGDGKDDVCARGAAGVQCELSTGAAFGSGALWSNRYSDANNWGTSEGHWGTIQYVDLNGDGKDDICGRAGGGIACGLSTGSTFATPTTWNANFSDAAGWGGSRSYYGTIRYADVTGDGKLDVCGRGAGGIVCGPSTGTSFAGPQTWNSEFSDANGYGGSESYYGTIEYPDVNGDGRADVCGRRSTGILCGLSNSATFVLNTLRSSGFSNAAGWIDNENQWRTIRYPDLNNDKKADVCGRSADGVVCAR